MHNGWTKRGKKKHLLGSECAATVKLFGVEQITVLKYMTVTKLELTMEEKIKSNVYFEQQTVFIGHRRIQWTHGPTPGQSLQVE